jgi:hypothetical protein
VANLSEGVLCEDGMETKIGYDDAGDVDVLIEN